MVVANMWNQFGEVEVLSLLFHNLKPELKALCGVSGASTVQSASTFTSSVAAIYPRHRVIPVLTTNLYICHASI